MVRNSRLDPIWVQTPYTQGTLQDHATTTLALMLTLGMANLALGMVSRHLKYAACVGGVYKQWRGRS